LSRKSSTLELPLGVDLILVQRPGAEVMGAAADRLCIAVQQSLVVAGVEESGILDGGVEETKTPAGVVEFGSRLVLLGAIQRGRKESPS